MVRHRISSGLLCSLIPKYDVYRGCQTQTHNGPKFKTGTKSQLNLNIWDVEFFHMETNLNL